MTLIKREDAIDELRRLIPYKKYHRGEWVYLLDKKEVFKALNALPSPETTKKKAELKENGDWDCPDVYCDECDHHRSVEWCSLAIPKHEEIDETYKMVNEAFFEGFNVAEKQYRLLIETVEEIDKKSSEAEWIPCSDRLPKAEDMYQIPEQRYLCQLEAHGVRKFCVLSRLKGAVSPFWDWYGIAVYDSDVIAWMPLPKPYREESEVE